MDSPADLADKGFRLCEDCGSAFPAMHNRHRARWCPGYADIWAGDQRRCLFEGLKAYSYRTDERFGEPHVLMVTLTGPGEAEGLLFDRNACAARGPHKCSGKLGCRVIEAVANVWNGQAPSQWSKLRNVSAQAVERSLGVRPDILGYTWEQQARGIEHLHVVLAYATPGERAASQALVEEFRRRGSAHFFGDQLKVTEPMPAERAAAYLSSYFVAGKKGKMHLAEAILIRDRPHNVVYVRTDLKQASGVSMRTLRLKRFAWIVWDRYFSADPGEGIDADLIWQNFVRDQALVRQFSASL